MGALAIGQVVLVPLPFSDLSRSKMRPAIILANAKRDDWVLCQVTSNPYRNKRAIKLTDDDFKIGSLSLTSYARPAKLFTANGTLVAATVGSLRKPVIKSIIDEVVVLLQEGTAQSN